MMLNLLYPSDDFTEVTDIYKDESFAFQQAGFDTILLDFNEFYEDKVRIKPNLTEKNDFLYRGWMLSPTEYQMLFEKLTYKGYFPITSPQQYQNCHYLPNWYEILQDFTPKTLFTDNLDNISELYHQFDSQKVFIKDYVKSDTTTDSTANSLAEIYQIMANIKNFRGKIEGGICLREFIELDKTTEERYFIYQHQAYSRDGNLPSLVTQIADKIDSPFFSVDTCFDTQGKLWLIEIGDGQVSDIKKWQVTEFVKIFTG